MIKDEEIIFVTTTLGTKWLDKQRKIIKGFFPDSDHLIISGNENWPYSWFYWIDELKNRKAKWFVHIDEDCFLTDKNLLIELIEKMDNEGYSLSAVSDGYHHYRGANSVAINSFFMVGKVDDIVSLDFNLKEVEFWMEGKGWKNNLDIYYDEEKHGFDFNYPHEIMENDSDRSYEQEPYYALLWMLKERGKKFYYLYPHFDQRFKSTNPRIDKDSKDIAIHMWYTRFWDSPMMVHNLPNHIRYSNLDAHLKEKFGNV